MSEPVISIEGVSRSFGSTQAVDDLRGQTGVAGEAVYRSPVMFSGYYRDEAATREALEGGWFHSGDSFIFDDQDSVHIRQPCQRNSGAG